MKIKEKIFNMFLKKKKAVDTFERKRNAPLNDFEKRIMESLSLPEDWIRDFRVKSKPERELDLLFIRMAILKGTCSGLVSYIEDNINKDDFKSELLCRVEMLKPVLERMDNKNVKDNS